MSRSRKKLPHYHSDGQIHIRWAKKQSNKKVRKTEFIANGGAYKKIYERWDIRDLICVYWNISELLEWCDPKDVYKYYMK